MQQRGGGTEDGDASGAAAAAALFFLLEVVALARCVAGVCELGAGVPADLQLLQHGDSLQ